MSGGRYGGASKLQPLRTMHLFAGAGGGILADVLLGHQPVCAVEVDPYCQQVLSARQKDGALPWFPIFADVQEFDGKPWSGLVDCVAGGFPCQDISAAGKATGSKAKGRDYGGSLRGLLAKYDPNASSWKTAQCSLLADLDRFSETWPRWGLMRGGGVYPQPTQVPITSVTESGLWPTLTRRDYRSDSCTPTVKAERDSHARGKTLPWVLGGLVNPTWAEWLMGFPGGWTELRPLEMHKFQEWQRQHSPCSAKSEAAA